MHVCDVLFHCADYACVMATKLHVILREKLQKSESLSTSAILHKSVSAYVHIIQTYKIIDISETQLQSFLYLLPIKFLTHTQHSASLAVSKRHFTFCS